MIEDLKELGADYEDDDLWWAYFELCQESSKFSGLTKIRRGSEFEYYIDILDLANNFNTIFYIKIYWTCGAYEIEVYERFQHNNYYTEFDVIKRAMIPKERLKSAILSYFNWITT